MGMPELRRLADSASEVDRLKAVDQLFLSGELAAVPLLEGLAARDPSLHVRYMAQRSLHLLRRSAEGAVQAPAAPPTSEGPATSDGPAASARPALNLDNFQGAWRAASPEQRRKLVRAAVHFRAAEAGPFLAEQAGQEGDIETRALLSLAVGILAGQAGVPALASRVQDVSPKVRLAALEGLTHVRHGSAWPLVVRALQDEDQAVRGRAAAALRSLGKETLCQVFDKMIESPQIWMRDSAAYAMSVVTSVAFLPMLQKGAKDRDREVRRKVRTGLERLAEKGVTEAAEALRIFSEATVAFHDEALELFGKIEIGEQDGPDPLFDADPATRRAEVERVVAANDVDRAAPLCMRLEDEEDPELRAAICDALGRVGNLGVIKFIVRRLGDEAAPVRAAAIQALVALCPEDPPEEVAPLLQDPSPIVQSRAAVALKDLPSADVVPVLLKLAEHEDEAFRDAAFYAATAIADLRMAPIIARLLDDESGHIWERAVQFMRQLHAQGSPLAAAVLERLPPGHRELLGARLSTQDAMERFERAYADDGPPRG